jgi:hypothetical protein
MTQPDPQIVPVQRRFIRAETANGRITLKRRLGSKQFRLNGSSKVVWSLCDGQNTVETICELMELSFRVDDHSIRQDVLMILSELEKAGLLKFESRPLRARNTETIDLREIPFYVINCKSDPENRDRMKKQLTDYGLRFEFVNGMECQPGNVGTAISHLRVLNRTEIETPFGVLEDDCIFSEHFRYEFTIPSNTDAFYLGISRFGIEKPGELSWGKWDQVQWSRYDRYNLRVFNMLARHAVLYLSDTFRKAAQEAMVRALTNYDYMFPGDVGLASTHLSHLVLTPNVPICIQAKVAGGQEGATDKALPDL